MCVVSMIIDHTKRDYPGRYPWYPWEPDKTSPYKLWPKPTTTDSTYIFPSGPSQQQFDALKKEVEELKKIVKAAKEYDEATGQPDCEVDEKVDMIKKLADYVGVDMNDVFGETRA